MSEQEIPKSAAFSDAAWAKLELMGHRVRVGKVRKENLFGVEMCRIDVLQANGEFHTEYYGGSSIYAVLPCSEDVAMSEAKHHQQPPVNYYSGSDIRDAAEKVGYQKGFQAAQAGLPAPKVEEPIERPPSRTDRDEEEYDDEPF